ncbi:SRPBCC family protein [Sporosarcina sp. FSL K6-5500]|uniref:SRPBCC family protein n=1 Tax=Sporosarcina sp. FSL K6-5500 TaxID=2921558 RepID=UPI0030FB7972
MPIIRHEISIHAPIQVCFDFARTVEVHAGKTLLTKQIAIEGITFGLMERGDFVTWETAHLGLKQKLTSQVIEMVKPYRFTDAMVHGAFHSFTHRHEFIERGTETIMIDTFSYKSPFGILGKVANHLFLEKYMSHFIARHAQKVKRVAEATKY